LRDGLNGFAQSTSGIDGSSRWLYGPERTFRRRYTSPRSSHPRHLAGAAGIAACSARGEAIAAREEFSEQHG
jgi:hypothetical protein